MKGISSIITSVILIAVAVTVVGIYSGWAPEYAESFTEQAVENMESEMNCENANFRIDRAEYSETDRTVETDITNTGTITFQEDVYLYLMSSSTTVINEDSISRLEVDGTRTTEIDVDTNQDDPEKLVATSQQCPEMEETIDVNTD